MLLAESYKKRSYLRRQRSHLLERRLKIAISSFQTSTTTRKNQKAVAVAVETKPWTLINMGVVLVKDCLHGFLELSIAEVIIYLASYPNIL